MHGSDLHLIDGCILRNHLEEHSAARFLESVCCMLRSGRLHVTVRNGTGDVDDELKRKVSVVKDTFYHSMGFRTLRFPVF